MLEVKPRQAPGSARSDPQAGLSIAEAARRTGVSVHTLRYYERAVRDPVHPHPRRHLLHTWHFSQIAASASNTASTD
jgi:hypothetical protein